MPTTFLTGVAQVAGKFEHHGTAVVPGFYTVEIPLSSGGRNLGEKETDGPRWLVTYDADMPRKYGPFTNLEWVAAVETGFIVLL